MAIRHELDSSQFLVFYNLLLAHHWKVLGITSIGLFMASLDLFIVNIALPDLSRSFDDASLGSLSWVLPRFPFLVAARVLQAVGAALLAFSLPARAKAPSAETAPAAA